MKMERLIIQVPARMKAQLDAERQLGTSAAGLIRHLLGQRHVRARPRSAEARFGCVRFGVL